MANKIAIVRLAPGEIGYYDSLSRIHLTLGNKEAIVYSDMNNSKLRQDIKSGKIELVSGTLLPLTGSFDHKDDSEFFEKIKTPELIPVEKTVYINKNEEVITEETKKSKKKGRKKKK